MTFGLCIKLRCCARWTLLIRNWVFYGMSFVTSELNVFMFCVSITPIMNSDLRLLWLKSAGQDGVFSGTLAQDVPLTRKLCQRPLSTFSSKCGWVNVGFGWRGLTHIDNGSLKAVQSWASLSVCETREGQGVEQGAGPDPQPQLTTTIQRWNRDNRDAGMEGKRKRTWI